MYGLVVGGIAAGRRDLVSGNAAIADDIRELGGQQNLTDALLATAMSIMALFTAAYAVQSVQRLRAEESSGRLEPILATGVSRVRWAVSGLTVTVAGTVVLLALTGAAVGVVHGARSHDFGGELPASWPQRSSSCRRMGHRRRAPSSSPSSPRHVHGWGVLTICLLLGQVAPLLNLPQAVMDVSPFTHTPKLPGGAVAPLPSSPSPRRRSRWRRPA